MNVDELLADTFAAHEHLAPDPAALLRDLPHRRRRRFRMRMAVGATVVAVAAITVGGVVVTRIGDAQGHDHAVAADQSASVTIDDPTENGAVIPVADRKMAGDFSGDLLGGGRYKLNQQAGKVVVVNFWATWCRPCRLETSWFDVAYRDFERDDVTFVGVDVKDSSSSAETFVTDNHISYPVVFDQQGETAAELGELPVDALPLTVLVDQSGRIAANYTGEVTSADLARAITTLLAEK